MKKLLFLLLPLYLYAEVLDENFDLNQLKGQKLGYYTGSFDPVHLGHEHVATQALNYVDYVLIYPVPGGDTFKHRNAVALRQKMIASVFQDHPKILITYWTPKELQDKLPDLEVIGIIGSDVADSLLGPENEKKRSIFMRGLPLSEKHSKDTVGALMALRATSFLVAKRGDVDLSHLNGMVADRPILAFIQSTDISSTAIKIAIQDRLPFEQWLAAPVQAMIKQEHLYRH